MRTALTQAQITAILAKHFDGINFAMYQVDEDGTLGGVVVDHAYSTDIPDASEWDMTTGESRGRVKADVPDASVPQKPGEYPTYSAVAEAMDLEGTMKPCPFCGSANIDASFSLSGEGYVTAGCMQCGASGPDCDSDRPLQAAAAWNRRV